ENNCLLEMINFFKHKRFNVGSLCFDGCLIEKDEKKIVDQKLLNECMEHVKIRTKYQINLLVKPMDEKYEIPKYGAFVDSDEEAVTKLLQIVGKNKFKNCDGILYVYNDTTGMYDSCKKKDTPWQR